MKNYRDGIRAYLDAHRPRPGTVARTKWYSSGRVALRRGDQIVLVSGANGIQYIYHDGVEQADIAHGKGLLYTFDSWEEADKYVTRKGSV